MLVYIIKINGIYDIICSLVILKIINIPCLQNIHLSMIKDVNKCPILERFFAYWIFTYGIIRINNHYMLTSYFYYIEAAFFMNEYINDSIYFNKAIFVISSSLLLGYLSYPKY